MKMRLMKKCLRAARINRLIQPIACALADDKPLEMDRDACMRVLEAVHPDTGRSAIWPEPLPPEEDGALMLDVIIPAHNAEATLAECMRSVLEQKTTYTFRVILVDDGSMDGTAAAADSYADYPRVTVLHQQNGGAANARNNGMRHSKGPYLMFLDADDRLAPGAIEQLMACVAEADADLAEGGYFNFKAAIGAPIRIRRAGCSRWRLTACRGERSCGGRSLNAQAFQRDTGLRTACCIN